MVANWENTLSFTSGKLLKRRKKELYMLWGRPGKSRRTCRLDRFDEQSEVYGERTSRWLERHRMQKPRRDEDGRILVGHRSGASWSERFQRRGPWFPLFLVGIGIGCSRKQTEPELWKKALLVSESEKTEMRCFNSKIA